MADKEPRSSEEGWDQAWYVEADGRVPGTRRLWLASAMIVVIVFAMAVGIAVDDGISGQPVSSATVRESSLDLDVLDAPSTTADAKTGEGRSDPVKASAAPESRDRKALHASPRPSPSASASVSAQPSRSASATPRPAPAAEYRSIRSVNYPDRYWRISDGLVKLEAPEGPKSQADLSFAVVPGLAEHECLSFTAGDGFYLRHRDFLLRSERNDNTPLFRQDATFCIRPSTHPQAVMLESVNYPGRFLRHQNFQLKLHPFEDSELYRADSAFRLVTPLRD
ncbi:AbfB domain-containing protein [Streptomyces sp. NPDC058739]|uniref:AbfB domain-containing protein n=1 Tax=Streptomyces sp. NPDC058739 TaxID=3346618 RepID=UPI00367999C9